MTIHDDIKIPDYLTNIAQEITSHNSKALRQAAEELGNSLKKTISNPINDPLSEMRKALNSLGNHALKLSTFHVPDYSFLTVTDTLAEAHNSLLPAINEFIPAEKLDDTVKENLQPVVPKSKITFKDIKKTIKTILEVAALISTIISNSPNDTRQYDANPNTQYITESVQYSYVFNTFDNYIDVVINEVSATSDNTDTDIPVDMSNETEIQEDDMTED